MYEQMKRAVILAAWLLSVPLAELFAAHCVAVLPFENTNEDSKLDWLSMGIADTVTNDLWI